MKISNLFYNLMHISYIHAEGDVDYATRTDGTTLYIYFQHSQGKVDWKNNFDFPAKPYKHMKCKDAPYGSVWLAHRGFLSAWRVAEGLLKEQISDTGYTKIVISGYSHGAALAVLCHEYVWYNRPDLREVIEGYGFGCPRVAWGIKNACHRERWARFNVIRNIDDIVTHVPPAILGYFHVGNMVEIGQRGKYSAVEAHFPDSYMRELLKYHEL